MGAVAIAYESVSLLTKLKSQFKQGFTKAAVTNVVARKALTLLQSNMNKIYTFQKSIIFDFLSPSRSFHHLLAHVYPEHQQTALHFEYSQLKRPQNSLL